MHTTSQTLPLLTASEAAEILNVSKPRIYELARRGLIPSVALGRQRRWHREVVDEFLRQGGQSLPGGWRRKSS